MKNLLIIGARGFGREIYNLAQRSIGFGAEFVIKGFLDDKSGALDGMHGYPSILGSVEEYKIKPDDVFICALGDVKYKRKYVEMILAKGGEFISLIDKSAAVFSNTIIGKGCIISQFTTISCETVIGNFVTIQGRVTVGHDARLGDWVNVGTGAFFGGFAVVETMATVHTLGIVLPHKVIGNGATVGAGCVVMRNVKPNTTVFGNPARVLNIG